MELGRNELSVGEVSRRVGVAVSALHFYEAQGLIGSRRNSGNQRRYSRDVLRRVSLIKVAQNLGLTLAEIKEQLKLLPHDRTVTNEDWYRLAQSWRVELDVRIERLKELRESLDTCIGCGCLSTKDCPLRNPDDVLSSEGKGPRHLRLSLEQFE